MNYDSDLDDVDGFRYGMQPSRLHQLGLDGPVSSLHLVLCLWFPIIKSVNKHKKHGVLSMWPELMNVWGLMRPLRLDAKVT